MAAEHKNKGGRPLLKHHQEDIKAKIQVNLLIQRLNKHIAGEIELSQTQIKAIDMLLARTMPTLTAVEQTNVNPDDKLDDSAILERFKALVAANPELLQQLIALSSPASDGGSQPTAH